MADIRNPGKRGFLRTTVDFYGRNDLIYDKNVVFRDKFCYPEQGNREGFPEDAYAADRRSGK